ncbi:hypothetical protein ACTS9C_15910 [Empedobacter brevis]
MDLNGVKDFVVETKDIALNRLKYPLLKFYIFFIIICNWDIIMFVFLGDADINMRVASIKNSIKETELNILGVNINFVNLRWLMPMIYSLISYLLFPYISFEIEKIISKVKNQQIDLESEEQLKIAKNQYEISLELSGKRSYDELNTKIIVLEKEKEDNFKLYQQAVKEKDKVINESIKKEEFFRVRTNEINEQKLKIEKEFEDLKNNNLNGFVNKKTYNEKLESKLNSLKLLNEQFNPNNFSKELITGISVLLNDFLDNFSNDIIKLDNLELLEELLSTGEVHITKNNYKPEFIKFMNILEKYDVFEYSKGSMMYEVTEFGKKLYKYLNVEKNIEKNSNRVD